MSIFFTCEATGTDGSHQLVETKLWQPHETRKLDSNSQVKRDQYDASATRNELIQGANLVEEFTLTLMVDEPNYSNAAWSNITTCTSAESICRC